MSKGNIPYTTDNLSLYFSNHRTRWDSLYPSEKTVIERLGLTAATSVLDMGCACGGLGAALRERFDLCDYTGVDINPQCIAKAPALLPSGTFLAGDFLEVSTKLRPTYDVTFSLGCADWNVETEKLIAALFERTSVGGSLVISCRVTNHPSVRTVIEGKQNLSYRDFGGVETSEWAPYKVYQLSSLLALYTALPSVASIYAYGYWGPVPPSVEGIPFSSVFFIVFAIRRGDTSPPPRIELDVSSDLLIPVT